MPGRVEFHFGFGQSAPSRPGGGAGRGPMRLLVLGDFSARPAAQRPPLAARPTHRVDVDSLDSVLQRLAPTLALPAGAMDFTQLEDFHPDALYQRLGLFDALRRARANPPAGGGGLLGQLLGKTGAPVPAPASSATGVDALIRHVVGPQVVLDNSSTLQPYLAAVDTAITEQMRKLLHDPAFQALESAWRGVSWLIASLELDEKLELHLFDVGRDELLADIVAAQGQLAQTGLHRALSDRWRYVPGGTGWSLLTGLYRFGPSDTDIGLLAALGLIASQAGGPFVGAGDPALAGGDASALQGWNLLRHSEAAPWIGLAAPRVLLRLPYGKGSDPVASFAFEELAATPVHEEYLWGPGSLAVALLIGRAFTARGWAFEPGDEREIGDLPAYSYLQDGERELQACAERYLGEQAGNALLAAGLMPLLSHRDRNAVTVMRFGSVAAPPAPLAGVWQKA